MGDGGKVGCGSERAREKGPGVWYAGRPETEQEPNWGAWEPEQYLCLIDSLCQSV